MTPFVISCLVTMSAILAIFAWFCVFRTNTLVTRARKNHEKSKFAQAFPFSGQVLKPWYPTYIRCAGILIWLSTLAILYRLTVKHLR